MGWMEPHRADIDARLTLLNDAIVMARRGDITGAAAAAVVTRLAPALAEHLRATDPDATPYIPAWLDREVTRLTKTRSARPRV